MDPTTSSTLPNASQAYVPEEKVRDYLMCPDHETGRHKCRVFCAAFGWEPSDWEQLRDRLLAGLDDAVVTGATTGVGCVKYKVSMTWQGHDGKAKRVTTIWKVPEGGGAPSLVTAYLST